MRTERETRRAERARMGPASSVQAAHRPAVAEAWPQGAPPGHGRPRLAPPASKPPRGRWLGLRRRPIEGTDRHGLAAGQVLVVMAICFGLWGLLSAHSLRKSAEASSLGARRTAALAVLRPLDALSHVLFLDRLAGVAQRAAGHDPDRVSPGGGFLADGPQPSAGPPVGSTGSIGHGARHGRNHGNGRPGHRTHPGKGAGAPGPNRPRGAGRSGGGTAAGVHVPPLRVPTPAHPLRVLVVGDSFAEDIELGLSRALDSDTVRLIPKGVHSTGLSRPDYYNWPVELGADMARYRPDVVVIMVGGNDPQGVQSPSGDAIAPFGVGDRRWGRTYRARVDRFIREASWGRTHVAWVGLPAMQDPAFSRNIGALDAIYQQEVARFPGTMYVDTWRLSTDANGHYATYLPNATGDLQLVREPDGVHFTSVGNDRP